MDGNRNWKALAGLACACALVAAPGARAAAGDVFVADYGAFGATGGVLRVDTAGLAQTELASAGSFADPAGVAVAADGSLYVADFGAFSAPGGGLMRVDATSGEQSVIATGGAFQDPWGVAEAPDGSVLVADPNAAAGLGALIRVNPATGAQSTVSSGGAFADPIGVAIGPGGEIYVVDQSAIGGNGAVFRVDPVTGAQATVSSGGSFVDPMGIAVGDAGQLLVADQNPFGAPRVFRVNPATGAQTVITSGGNLDSPVGLAVEPSGTILVADQNAFGGLGGVVRVDPASGAQTVLSSAGLFSDPVGVAVVPNRPPVPAFTVANAVPLVGEVFTFDASSTTDDGAGVTRYEWDLDGDGTYETDTGTSPIATRTYDEPRDGPVRLRATDNYGAAAETERTVTVTRLQQPPPPPELEPTLGKIVDAIPMSGTVTYRVPGAKQFSVLTEGEHLPVGSTVDATRGRVRIISDDGFGHRQSGLFFKGAFIVRQRKVRFSPAELVLTDPPKRKAAASARKRGRQALTVRELWGVSRGHFRTRGRFASATVRGTQWITRDLPNGTLVRVRRGVVTVRDFIKHKSVTVRAVRSYFTRRPRR